MSVAPIRQPKASTSFASTKPEMAAGNVDAA
jgi:hypothetical protein